MTPKEGWACLAARHPSFGMTPTFREYNQNKSMMSAESNSEKSVSYQKKDPSFGMTTTKTLRSVFS